MVPLQKESVAKAVRNHIEDVGSELSAARLRRYREQLEGKPAAAPGGGAEAGADGDVTAPPSAAPKKGKKGKKLDSDDPVFIASLLDLRSACRKVEEECCAK